MRRFYHSSSLKLNTTTPLDDFAARHLAQVLRAKVGDRIILFNGDGFDYEAQIKHVDRRDVSVEILNQSANSNEHQHQHQNQNQILIQMRLYSSRN